MITDEQIERLLYRYAYRQDVFSMSVIKIIAERLSHLADFDDLDALHKEQTIRTDLIRMNSLYSDYVKDQIKRLKEDLWWIAVVIYLESIKFYEKQVELKDNKPLNDVIRKITETAQKNFTNLILLKKY